MALPSISVADFIGEIRLSQDVYNADSQQDFIDEKYPEIIRQILGDYAYTEILGAVSLPSKWADLLNGATYTNLDGGTSINDGLVKACKYLIWYQLFVQDWQNTTAGNVVNMNENSTRLSGGDVSSIAGTRWNKGCRIIEGVYRFVWTFEKVEAEIASSVDNSDDTYTFAVDTTKYLAVGDIVYYSSVELEVVAITANTDITVDAGAVGLSFSGEIYWMPFAKYKMPFPAATKSSGF